MLGSQNHQVGYPKKVVWYGPTGMLSSPPSVLFTFGMWHGAAPRSDTPKPHSVGRGTVAPVGVSKHQAALMYTPNSRAGPSYKNIHKKDPQFVASALQWSLIRKLPRKVLALPSDALPTSASDVPAVTSSLRRTVPRLPSWPI